MAGAPPLTFGATPPSPNKPAETKQRKDEASIGSSQASAASSAATAEKTRRLLPAQERKEKALATKAELEAQKLQMALEKANRAISGRPAPENLEAAQKDMLYKFGEAAKALRLSREMGFATGLGSDLTSKLSGTPASTIKNIMAMLGGKEAFDALMKMRAESQTGAALGNVTERELQLLMNQAAVIDPSSDDETFQRGVRRLMSKYIEVMTKLGVDPQQIAAIIPPEDLPELGKEIKSYRFVPDDVKKISAFVDQARKNGTYDPADYAALMGEAYYNATGRKPDEAFIRGAFETGNMLAQDPKATLSDFDYQQADLDTQKRVLGTPAQEKELGLGEALGSAAWNFVPSTFELAADTVKALTVNLPDTIEGIVDVVGGATGLSDDPTAYEALKKYYTDRYGSYAGFKKALATDPASILADVAGLFTGGATLAAKGLSTAGKVSKISALSNAAKTAEGFGQFAAKVDPLALAGKATGKGLDLGTRAAEAVAVDLPAKVAGVQSADVKQAFSAGKRGSQGFREQITGTGDVMDPIAKAEAGLNELYQARSADYQRRMAKMDKTEGLDFADVEKAIEGVRKVGRHKGIDISGAGKVWDEIDAKYMEFLDKGLNTIEDFDAMKRAVKEIGSRYQLGTPEYKVANQVAKSINDTIVAKAPVYANIMKDYRLASDTLSDIKASASIDAKSADTTLGKLQRAASGKGPRGRTVLDMLEATPSGRGLGDMLAGQNLSGTEAKGFAPTLATPAAMATGDVTPLGALLVTPRGLGEKAYSLGEKYGMAERGAQAVRGTQPVQRAEELAAKYAPSLYKTAVIANPAIQAQVDPFSPAQPPMSDEAMAALMQRYKIAPPSAVMSGGSNVRLGDLVSAYGQEKPKITLADLIAANQEPKPEEEEDTTGYARGGLVMAPMLGGY